MKSSNGIGPELARLFGMTQFEHQQIWIFSKKVALTIVSIMMPMTKHIFFGGLFLDKLILVTFQPSCKHSAACFQQLQFHHKGPTNERNAK